MVILHRSQNKEEVYPVKKSIAFLVAIAFSLSLAACGGSADPEVSEPSADISAPEASVPGPDVPDYRLIDSSEYSRDGKDCVGYRVEIAEDASEEDMRAVFSELSAADAYYLHTVWYYGLASDVETIGSYTVGQLEEVAEGSEPVFTAPALSAAEIAALREGSAADRSIPAPTIKQEALVPENLFTPAPEELFSTPASENGLGDSAFYVEGKIEERAEVGGYDSLRVSTVCGEIWVSSVTIPLGEIAEGDEVIVYFVYAGWSESLSAAAGEYVYHE